MYCTTPQSTFNPKQCNNAHTQKTSDDCSFVFLMCFSLSSDYLWAICVYIGLGKYRGKPCKKKTEEKKYRLKDKDRMKSVLIDHFSYSVKTHLIR